MSDRKPIRRALLSVYDKTGLVELGKVLSDSGIEILSTGSTAKTLQTAGIQVREVSSYTGFPEIMGGRVKTLHPRIHSGILADQKQLRPPQADCRTGYCSIRSCYRQSLSIRSNDRIRSRFCRMY